MKIVRFVILLTFCYGMASVSAQNLKLFHNEVDVSNEDLSIAQPTTDGDLKVIFNIHNTSTEDIEIKVKKNVREDIEGAENTFCLGSCFDPSVTESPTTLTVAAGETTGPDNFYVLFLPNGHVGNAMIVYEVFNVNDTEDNVMVTVHYSFFGSSLLLFYNDVDVSDGEINIGESSSLEEIKVIINIKNSTAQEMDIKVKKNVRSDIDGAENTFCLGSCFDPSVTESPTSITIGAGETTGPDDFYVIFYPNGNSGEALIIYDVFNADNPDEKVTVTVNFAITSNKIDITESNVLLNLYPNPACGNSMFIEYNLPGDNNTELVVYNMLGEQLVVQPLLLPMGTMEVDITGLAKGLYFVSFEQLGHRMATAKFIISR